LITVATSLPWLDKIRSQLTEIPFTGPEAAREFFARNFVTHRPEHGLLDTWKAFDWTLEDLKIRIGNVEVQVQIERASDPNYEIRSGCHRGTMPFDQFVDRMLRAGNDVYMTAQNNNQHVLAPLFNDIGELPPFLEPNNKSGFMWIGSNSITPLHHDETQNVMCQVMGLKLVRMIDPDQERYIRIRSAGVHSHIGWPTDQKIMELGLKIVDYWLRPGEYLYLPIGWWHAVRSYGPSITCVYTSFIWPSFYGRYC
jgi:hypothetical protein